MTARPHSFRRLVLGLQPSASDRAMQLAVETAALLGIELLGLFLEESSLSDLAGIPFVREFRPLNGGWHPIDPGRLSSDLELAARSAGRIFADAAKRLSTGYQFEVIRGPTAKTIASVSQTGDIVMILEPLSPAERAAQQFSWLQDAALQSEAAVMLVPRRIARRTGPVVAVAVTPDDPSIDAAAAIAVAAGEDLIVVEACEGAADDARIRNLAADTGLTIKRVVAGKTPPLDWGALSAAFSELQERLVVVTRGTLNHDAISMMTSARHVPVLVVEPPDSVTRKAAPHATR
jgi:hypothetical protein